MRVVLDTNILVSACWKPGGNESIVLQLALNGDFSLCVSNAVLSEYRAVFARPKFAHLGPTAHQMLAQVDQVATRFQTLVALAIAQDPDDNRLLECAQSVEAEYLVTGNLRHFPESMGNTRVVNARQFLNLAFPGKATSKPT